MTAPNSERGAGLVRGRGGEEGKGPRPSGQEGRCGGRALRTGWWHPVCTWERGALGCSGCCRGCAAALVPCRQCGPRPVFTALIKSPQDAGLVKLSSA